MQLKKIAFHIAIPLMVGGISAFLCKDSFLFFSTIRKPPLSPPMWVFPVAWIILYVLMGVGSYRVAEYGVEEKLQRKAFLYYWIQLALNFLWTPVFFLWKNYLVALIVLGILYFFIWQMYQYFTENDMWAGRLQIPYIVWSSFAIYLNAGVFLLNS